MDFLFYFCYTGSFYAIPQNNASNGVQFQILVFGLIRFGICR